MNARSHATSNTAGDSRTVTPLEGTSSVLFARARRETELLDAARDYLGAIEADPDLLYADLHATKHTDKFVLIEMYRDAGARERQARGACGIAWAEAKDRVLTDESVVERIRPVMTAPPERARPIDAPAELRDAPIVCAIGADCQPFGAFVRVFPRPETLNAFTPVLERQGALIAAGEPGFLFADMYLLDAPGYWLVIEYYDDRRSLSHHHTLPHTLQFAENKARAGYESQKHQAFTMRPIASVGPYARLFRKESRAAAQSC